MNVTVKSGKSSLKNWVIRHWAIFPFRVKAITLSKKVHFLEYCAELSKKSKFVKAIYIYASQRSRYALS